MAASQRENGEVGERRVLVAKLCFLPDKLAGERYQLTCGV